MSTAAAGTPAYAEASLGSRLSVLPYALAPNKPLAAAVLVATFVETGLLSLMQGGILECEGPSRYQVPFYLFGVWWLTGWTLGALSGMVGAVGRRLRPAGLLLGIVAVVGLLMAAMAHLGSWGLYFRTGRFGTVDALEFLLHNSGESWMLEYFWNSERTYVYLGAAVALVVGLGIVWMVRLVRHAAPPDPAVLSQRGIRLLRLSFCLLMVTTYAVLGAVRSADAGMIRQGIWADAVRFRLNPTVGLVMSTIRRAVAEPIAPVLAVTQLSALDPGLSSASLPTPLVAAADESPAANRPPSVVFLAVESLRHDVVHLVHQDQEVTPNLNKLAKAGVQFTRAYAQSTHSDYSDVCIVSSLYPLRKQNHHFYTSHDPWPRTLIYDVLKGYGHATANISSQNEKWGGMDAFLTTPNLDWYYDAERSTAPTRLDRRDNGFAHEVKIGSLRGGSLDDSHTTDQAIAWIDAQAREGKRFFLNMNFQSSHFPYAMAPECPRPFQPAAMDFDASFSDYPKDKVPVVRNAYYNAVHECDRQLGRLVEALAERKLTDDVILVVLGENGEAFHENGAISHAGPPKEPTLRVALVVHAPKRLPPMVEDYPTELVDVVPTVLALCGLGSHPNFQGRDALATDRPPVAERLLFFHTENPLARSDALLYQGRWKLIHDRLTGGYELYDLAEDATESRNRFEAEPLLGDRLRSTLADWRARQLAYYHYPQYYLRFYPPQPPELAD
jgi:arylsulfatase A-like enzyme